MPPQPIPAWRPRCLGEVMSLYPMERNTSGKMLYGKGQTRRGKRYATSPGGRVPGRIVREFGMDM